jgi:hypothetical protein
MRAHGATFHGGGSASGIRDQLISTSVYFFCALYLEFPTELQHRSRKQNNFSPLRIETSEKRPSLVGFSSMSLDVG